MDSGNNINVSLIDYIGKIDNGVAIILSLILNEENYEMVYWIDRNKGKLLKIEEKFYLHYPQIKDIMEYEYIIDLLFHIETKILPPKEQIFKEFF